MPASFSLKAGHTLPIMSMRKLRRVPVSSPRDGEFEHEVAKVGRRHAETKPASVDVGQRDHERCGKLPLLAREEMMRAPRPRRRLDDNGGGRAVWVHVCELEGRAPIVAVAGMEGRAAGKQCHAAGREDVRQGHKVKRSAPVLCVDEPLANGQWDAREDALLLVEYIMFHFVFGGSIGYGIGTDRH